MMIGAPRRGDARVSARQASAASVGAGPKREAHARSAAGGYSGGGRRLAPAHAIGPVRRAGAGSPPVRPAAMAAHATAGRGPWAIRELPRYLGAARIHRPRRWHHRDSAHRPACRSGRRARRRAYTRVPTRPLHQRAPRVDRGTLTPDPGGGGERRQQRGRLYLHRRIRRVPLAGGTYWNIAAAAIAALLERQNAAARRRGRNLDAAGRQARAGCGTGEARASSRTRERAASRVSPHPRRLPLAPVVEPLAERGDRHALRRASPTATRSRPRSPSRRPSEAPI